jgi:choloylglycine hydrolase
MNCQNISMKPVLFALAGSMVCLSTQQAVGCTSLVFQAQDGTAVYARTMEWGASDLKSELVLVPRGMAFKSAIGENKTGMEWKNHYGFVGVNAAGLPYATDGMNEAGLTVGVLFYPGFAEFQEPSAAQQAATISSVDVANYLLSNFATVEQVRQAMPTIRVVRNPEIEKAFGTPIPIHHVITDATGSSIVVEYTKGTLAIYDNKIGVMTNSPNYDWHLLNLRNYNNLKAMGAPASRSIDGVSLAPFGAGSGMLGLPGDFTPPSRFIRAVAFVHTMEPVKDAREAVNAASTMLNNFDIPKGLVREGTSEDDYHLGYTQWSVIADTRHKVYYYWTMYDRRMRSVDFSKLDFDGKKVSSFPLDRVRMEDIEDRSADFVH